MSGHNREFEAERRLIDEQLQDAAETEEQRRERLQREAEAERLAQEQRQQQQQKVERLYLEATQRTPPEFHALVRKFLTDEECPPPSDDWPPAFHYELERLGFLRALAKNQDETTTRLVYADWLDERGEHEEADRQRKLPASHEWLVRFCKDNSLESGVSYDELIQFGREVTKDGGSSDRVHMHNENLWYTLSVKSEEFWKHWSVLTGIPLPPSMQQKGFHTWRCCSHEVYYWFGTPDTSEADE